MLIKHEILTPNEIKIEVRKINRMVSKEPESGTLFSLPVYRIKFLYALVLKEIAAGSIDPRTLAIEALKVNDGRMTASEIREGKHYPSW